MSRYRGNPKAIAALVQDDQVHRDVYIDPEIFELEMEQLWSNTWIYVGHVSQVPHPGDYATADIATRPVVMVRHEDGTVRVLMNRCAHKGSKVVERAGRKHRQVLPLPLPRLGLQHRRLDPRHPAQERLRRHADHGVRRRQGAGERCATSRSYRGFVFARLSDRGPGFKEYFGDSLSSIDNMADRSPEGELEITGGVLRYLHNCNWKMFVENLNDTMHPMVVHESSAGTAKKLWEGKPADLPKPMAVEQFVPFVSDYKFFDDMGVRVLENGHGWSGAKFSIHSNYAPDSRLRRADGRRLWRAACARDPGHRAPQHRLLPEPDHQGRHHRHPRGAADRGRQDLDRVVDASG